MSSCPPSCFAPGAWPMLLWIGVFFFFIIMPGIARGRKAHRMSHGLTPILVWEVLSAIRSSGGSGGGGGWSSGGGGGFSGGGGSSGGGGASGSW